MQEAIDYNALSWVRQALGETLKQARLKLEAYAISRDDAGLLHDCAAYLHEARGPLQMVDLRGADRLAAEMEEVLTDLLQGAVKERDEALEMLLQAFLQLPDYLSSIRSGQRETPAVLLPVINQLRACRGVRSLQERTFFSPDLSVPVPAAVYKPGTALAETELQQRARSARVRFQAGLLEWYRGGEDNSGLQTLVGVLESLLQGAGSEAAARLWWAGAGLADAVIAGELPESPGIKQLFGQLDRQIKRYLDSGEEVFADAYTDELLTSLLFEISQASPCTDRLDAIKSSYGLNGQVEVTDSDPYSGMSGISGELLLRVSGTVTEHIGHIKDLLDEYERASETDASPLLEAATALHALGNTLDLVGMGHLCQEVAAREQQLLDCADRAHAADATELAELAAAIVGVEDAVLGLAAEFSGHAGEQAAASVTFRQGLEVVAREVLADIDRVKEAIAEFSITPSVSAVLADVPKILERTSGSLQLAGLERAAALAGDIGRFVARHLQDADRDDERLELLAEALSNIEYYVEALVDDDSRGEAALDVAGQCMDTLSSLAGEVSDTSMSNAPSPAEAVTATDIQVAETGGAEPVVTGQQVIAADADEEILSIFMEEAGEQLAVLREYVPALLDNPGDADVLTGMQRVFHTVKGSGRMVGALAVGELARVFEDLLNRVIDGTVVPGEQLERLLAAAPLALEQLLDQVSGVALPLNSGIDALAIQAAHLNATENNKHNAAAAIAAPSNQPAAHAACAEATGMPDLPVLSADADEEIVEIFLEEAAEQVTNIAAALPVWISNPNDSDTLAELRRSFHTLKGSGRMAGAMQLGEFSWVIEDLLNHVIDGSVQHSETLASLVVQCGEVLPQLVKQLQDGTVPALETGDLMIRAAALARGEVEAPAPAVAGDGEATGVEASAAENAAAGELSLLEVFSNECRDHLAAITAFLEAGDEPRGVSESLYRALHTLSGISESAEIDSIQGLAGDLNVYFDELYQSQQTLSREALLLLGDAAAGIQQLVEQLPDLSGHDKAIQALRDRIAALPHPVAAADVVAVEAGDEVPPAKAVPETDLYSDLDQELYEIFIEESAELIDASESVLRSWSKDPDNTELLTEFQRQLHTLKGGARMVGIEAIGDLSHAVESLLARVVDGDITTSDDRLFAVLHASQDGLAEMLDRVRARELPGSARELEKELVALTAAQEPEVSVEQAAPEPGDQTGMEIHAGAAAVTDTNAVVDVATEGECVADTAVANEPDGVADATATQAEQAVVDQDAVVEQVVVGNISVASAHAAEAAAQRKDRRKPARARGEQVRVQSGLLDDMVNHAGEINIYRTRMEQQISDYRFNLAELDQTISRLREQLRQLEMETEIQVLFRYEQEGGADSQGFDPLEMDRYSNLQQLSRSLMESISDLRSLQDLMEVTTRESETLLLQQSRVSTDLQEGLMRTRMIPFAGLASRLRRVVRQTARQLDKKAELILEGGDGEIDRTVIDRIVAPLEHMLRNAVAHGIESPKLRNASGKEETGTITVSFEREGPEIVLRIADDGAGMDIETIAARAVERGLMKEDSGLKDDEILQFVLQTGFSTASDVTQISGRGVGMDVVNSEVKQLGGSLHIQSTAGTGSVFTLRLPYTLAINQVLLVRAGEQDFCIPLGSIEGVVRATPQELSGCYSADVSLYEYAGNQYQLKHLGSVLGTGGLNLQQMQERVPVLLARIGEKRMALQVESLLGSREIVIKPVGVQLSSVDGISGATILGDGRVVLILDMAALLRLNARMQLPGVQAAAQDESRIVVMVVDDSITVRKVTTRLLERNGFKVLTAKDGVDAVGQLQHIVPDMMLLDIEMPRMDGFELATHMRNDASLRHVPIIMITSRTGDKHRQRAHSIGVNNYLGKPYQENDLLDSIHRIIGVSSAAD